MAKRNDQRSGFCYQRACLTHSIPPLSLRGSHPFVACIRSNSSFVAKKRREICMLRFNNLLIDFLQPNFFRAVVLVLFAPRRVHSIWARLTFTYPISLAVHALSHSDSSVLLSCASLEQCHGLIAATALRVFYTSLGLEGLS